MNATYPVALNLAPDGAGYSPCSNLDEGKIQFPSSRPGETSREYQIGPLPTCDGGAEEKQPF